MLSALPARAQDEPPPENPVETARKDLQSDDVSARRRAAIVLGNLAATEAANDLIKVLKDKDTLVRINATLALAKLGKPHARGAVPALIENLQQDADNLRLASMVGLAALAEPNPEIVALVKKELKSGNPLVRQSALVTLAAFGTEAAEALPAIRYCLKDKNQDVRLAALFTIGQLGQAQEAVIAELRSCLKDKQPLVQLEAAASLWQLTKQEEYFQAVLQHAKSKDAVIKAQVSYILSRLSRTMTDTQLPMLQKIIKDEDTYDYSTRSQVVYMLAEFHPRYSEPVVRYLISLLAESGIRESAKKTLSRIGERSVPLLVVALKDKNETLRREAAYALGECGANAHSAITPLIEGLKDKESTVRQACARALGMMGSTAREAITALRDAEKDENSLVRQRARNAIQQIERSLNNDGD